MNDATLTVSEAIALSTNPECCEDILSTAPTTAQQAEVEATMGRLPYTTTALVAMARFLDDNGDTVGAELLRSMAIRFSVHESQTI